MRKILVTAISGDIGNSVLKILKKTKCRLFGCDVSKIAVGMDLVDEFWQCKYAIETGYVEELLEACKRYCITHLIPTNEREIEVIGKNREKFSNMGIKLLIQPQNVLKICLDKLKTMNTLSSFGISVPQTYSLNDKMSMHKALKEGRKLICKSRKSNGSKDIYFLKSETDFANLKQEMLSKSLIQEYIEGDEYTIGVFQSDSYVNVICFKRQIKNGYSYLVELIRDAEMESMAKKIADKLQIKGYINIQCKRTKDKYYVFEINPRISGTVGFRNKLGFMDVIWWLDMLDGTLQEKAYECRYQTAVGIRELNEKFLILNEK